MKKLALFLMLLAGPLQAADAPPNAANMALARRLVSHTGGVTVVLRLYGEGLASKAASLEDFRAALAQTITQNQAVIAAADEKLAATYARIYPARIMEAQLNFYDSPMGVAMAARYRNYVGQIIWPDPGNSSLSAEESAALIAFNANVLKLNAAAGANPQAMDGVMSAESDAIIKVRQGTYALYCQARDCVREGIKEGVKNSTVSPH